MTKIIFLSDNNDNNKNKLSVTASPSASEIVSMMLLDFIALPCYVLA